jgi:septation ring formation regulator EzrA
VRHCYQLLKQHLGKGFDTQDMLKSITQVTEELNAATAKLCELKGEFMQVNEAVINKDSNAMKPDFVKKSAKKQAAILEKFEALEAVVAEDARQTAELVEVYEDFEQALFDGTLASTKGVAEKTNQLIEEIDGSLDQMQTDLDQARIDVGSLVPQSKKDIKKLAAIRKKFNQVERAVKSADE